YQSIRKRQLSYKSGDPSIGRYTRTIGDVMAFFSATGFRSEREYTLYNKIAARLLPFLLLLYIVAFLDRINVAFAKLGMATDAGIGDAAYGAGAGIFFIAYCL